MEPAKGLEPDPLITNQMLYQLSYAGSVRNTTKVFRQNANTNNTFTKRQAIVKLNILAYSYTLFDSLS